MREDNNKQILVVDDEEVVTDVLSGILTEYGYTCKITTDPSTALEMIKIFPFACVLSDIRMLELSGIELMEKAKEINPDIDFIMVTALDNVNTAVKAIKMGACDYIVKPFDAQEILASVNNVIRSREERETESEKPTIANANNAEIRRREIEDAMQIFASTSNAAIISKDEKYEIQTVRELINGLARNLTQSFQIVAEICGTDEKVYSKMVVEHSERVEFFAINVAKRVSMPHGLRNMIAAAALLHDIGKIGMVVPTATPDNCLSKQDKQIYKAHPMHGAALVEPIKYLRTASWFIRHHHEKYGGGGYPDGLKGNEIPIGSRIIAVADAYDRYKYLRQQDEEYSEEKTRAHIRKGSGELFDPAVVKHFLGFLNELDHEENSGGIKKYGRRIWEQLRAPNKR